MIRIASARTPHALLLAAAVLLAGCATPDAPDLRGRWTPVNTLADAPQAIPLQQNYIYEALPVDGTLKSMLSRWAKDSRLNLSYLHPNDYTLYGPVGQIRTRSLEQAAAALSSAYAGQQLVVVVNRTQIVVRHAQAAAAVPAGTAAE